MKGRQGTGKPIQKYGQDGQRLQTYAKGDYSPIEEGETDFVIGIGIDGLRRTGGRPVLYEDSQAGIEAFVADSIKYLEAVRDYNNNPGNAIKAIPDQESLLAFIGCSRRTLTNYRRRGQEWQNALDMVQNALLACKKQLAQNGRIPAIFAIFDAINNSDHYRNTSEYKLTSAEPESSSMSSLGEIAESIGLDTEEG